MKSGRKRKPPVTHKCWLDLAKIGLGGLRLPPTRIQHFFEVCFTSSLLKISCCQSRVVNGILNAWCIDLDYKPALVVTRLDDPVPDGCTQGDCSLREAIITANGNLLTDTIIFDVTGIITLTQAGANENLAATGDLDITDDLMLVGRARTRPLSMVVRWIASFKYLIQRR